MPTNPADQDEQVMQTSDEERLGRLLSVYGQEESPTTHAMLLLDYCVVAKDETLFTAFTSFEKDDDWKAFKAVVSDITTQQSYKDRELATELTLGSFLRMLTSLSDKQLLLNQHVQKVIKLAAQEEHHVHQVLRSFESSGSDQWKVLQNDILTVVLSEDTKQHSKRMQNFVTVGNNHKTSLPMLLEERGQDDENDDDDENDGRNVFDLPEFSIGFARLIEELMKEGAITNCQAGLLQEYFERDTHNVKATLMAHRGKQQQQQLKAALRHIAQTAEKNMSMSEPQGSPQNNDETCSLDAERASTICTLSVAGGDDMSRDMSQHPYLRRDTRPPQVGTLTSLTYRPDKQPIKRDKAMSDTDIERHAVDKPDVTNTKALSVHSPPAQNYRNPAANGNNIHTLADVKILTSQAFNNNSPSITTSVQAEKASTQGDSTVNDEQREE